MTKLGALAKLFNIPEEDIQEWSDGSLTYDGYEYDTKKGIGEFVGKVNRYAFYRGSRI